MPGIAPAEWSAQETALWARIRAHPFERSDHALDFTRRLARDRGWSLAFARAAVEAYRRFCFLACAGSEPATPSEEVDEVWHLHLTYSRDYWEVWCGQVLRTPLHHDPTAGSPAEQARYVRSYADTLARHEAYFGPPDPALWPGIRERFGAGPRYRIVDTRRTLLLPRPRWAALPILAAALVLPPRPAQALPLNPLDWPGTPFLWLYGITAAGALLLVLVLRALCRRESGAVAGTHPPDLTLPDLAYLAGGPDRVTDIVALTLYDLGAAEIDPARRRIRIAARGTALPPDLEPFRPPDGEADRGTLRAALRAPIDRLAERLAARGLCPSPRQRSRARAWALVVLGLVLTFGAAKVGVGLSRGRPVGYLVFLMVATAAAGAVLLVRPLIRTLAGEAALKAQRARHARAARAPLRDEILLAFALGGSAALLGTELAAFRRYLGRAGDGGGGDGGGGGGDGSGSGGGGGCGGCGGGGGGN